MKVHKNVAIVAFVTNTHVLLEKQSDGETLDLPGVSYNKKCTYTDLVSSLRGTIAFIEPFEFEGKVINIVHKKNTDVVLNTKFYRTKIENKNEIETDDKIFTWLPFGKLRSDSRTKRTGKLIEYIVKVTDQSSTLYIEENQFSSWNDAKLIKWDIVSKNVDKA